MKPRQIDEETMLEKTGKEGGNCSSHKNNWRWGLKLINCCGLSEQRCAATEIAQVVREVARECCCSSVGAFAFRVQVRNCITIFVITPHPKCFFLNISQPSIWSFITSTSRFYSRFSLFDKEHVDNDNVDNERVNRWWTVRCSGGILTFDLSKSAKIKG